MFANEIVYKGRKYATNGSGEGLFVWTKMPGQIDHEYKQLLGSCDFNVNGLKDVRRKMISAIKTHGFEDVYTPDWFMIWEM